MWMTLGLRLCAFMLGWAAALAGAAPPNGPSGCLQELYGKVHCGPPDSRCMADRRNDLWCSPPGGAVEADPDGLAVCAVGGCAKDQNGRVFCSDVPRGGAMPDALGKVACLGTCVPASRHLCIKPTPAPSR